MVSFTIEEAMELTVITNFTSLEFSFLKLNHMVALAHIRILYVNFVITLPDFNAATMRINIFLFNNQKYSNE